MESQKMEIEIPINPDEIDYKEVIDNLNQGLNVFETNNFE